MTTSPMHTDGTTIAAAIDAAVQAGPATPNARTVTAATTLVAGDDVVIVNDASAVAVTVPENVFVAGDIVTVVNEGAGKATLTAGSGVTFHNSNSGPATIGAVLDQYDVAKVYFVSATVAILVGAHSS